MKMRSLAFATLLASVSLGPLPALHAQQASQTLGSRRSPAEEFKGKTLTMSGQVSADGKVFVSDQEHRSWQIINPKKLEEFYGKHVTIKGIENSPRDEFLVKTIHK